MTTIRILQGDVLKGLAILPDESVHCVVTSPPYWGLRDYQVEGQIGLEPTPEEYVEKIVEVFREVRRVLREDGVLWLNLGDSYAGSGKGPTGKNGIQQAEKRQGFIKGDFLGPDRNKRKATEGFKAKDLIGIPWWVAFALQDDGWWLRCDVVWSKPNPMPESVTDRPTKSHEYVFLLTKSEQYSYDRIAILEPSGANRRSVWEIPTQAFPEAHFATFPEPLVEPCIKAGTSERGCCPKCGAPWVRIIEKGDPDEEWKKECGADSEGEYRGVSHKLMKVEAHPPGTRPNDLHKQDALGKQTYTGFNARWKVSQQNASDVKRRILEGMRERKSRWEPGCQCDAGEAVPCVVLDPFAGSGTVATVARNLGRNSVAIEISPAYVEIMKKRLRLHEQLFQVPKIEQVE